MDEEGTAVSATADISAITARHPQAGRDSLIGILQEVQERDGFISQETASQIGAHLGLAASKVFGVATFYNQFRFNAPGRHHIQVCRGTACHVNNSAEILAAVERDLDVKAGQTTRDGQFSLEVVACIGACGQAPVVSVNGEFHAKLTPKRMRRVLAQYRKHAEARNATVE
jgi:NADH:ubiquinone oxidoreductase subunit E